jgi:hypothetical protein
MFRQRSQLVLSPNHSSHLTLSLVEYAPILHDGSARSNGGHYTDEVGIFIFLTEGPRAKMFLVCDKTADSDQQSRFSLVKCHTPPTIVPFSLHPPTIPAAMWYSRASRQHQAVPHTNSVILQ